MASSCLGGVSPCILQNDFYSIVLLVIYIFRIYFGAFESKVGFKKGNIVIARNVVVSFSSWQWEASKKFCAQPDYCIILVLVPAVIRPVM